MCGPLPAPNWAGCAQVCLCAFAAGLRLTYVSPNAGGARTPRHSVEQGNIPGVDRVPARTAAHQAAAAADLVGAPVPLTAAAAPLAHPAVILGDEFKVLMNACCCVSTARNSLLTVCQKSPVLILLFAIAAVACTTATDCWWLQIRHSLKIQKGRDAAFMGCRVQRVQSPT